MAKIQDKLVVKQMLIPAERYPVKAPFGMSPMGITIHETDNNAPAYNEIYYMGFNPSNFNNQVSYHFAVDEKEAIQGLPLDRNGWHSGDGLEGKGNRATIAIEICRNYRTDDLTNYYKSRANAEILTGWLMFLYGWNESNLYRHADWMNKNCPRNINNQGYWGEFKKNAASWKAVFAGQTAPVPNPTPTPNVKVKVGDTIKYKGRVYGDSMGNNPGVTVEGTYKVTIVNGNPYGVHIGSLGWVKTADVSTSGTSTGSTQTPAQGTKLKVGDRVRYIGTVFADSMGNRPGISVNGTFTVTIRNDNPYGIHIDNLGWVKRSIFETDAPSKPAPAPAPKPKPSNEIKTGDTIIFSTLTTQADGNGTFYYATSNPQYISNKYITTINVNGVSTKAYIAKVGTIRAGAKYPYDVLTTDGGVLGRTAKVNIYSKK